MRTRGVKIIDPVLDIRQIDWMIVPAGECPDPVAERRLIAAYFRKPHEPWGSEQAFVHPVVIRRSRRRVLFQQHSGLDR